MATKTKTSETLKVNRNKVMKSVKNIHNQVLETTEDLIEVSVETGEKYQKIAAKAIKKSEPLITKQVDIVFDTLEELFDQYESGTKRILDLLGVNDQVELAKNVSKSVVKAARKRFGKNMVSFASTTSTAAETIKKATSKVGRPAAKKAAKTVSEVIKPSAKKAAKKATKATKAVTTKASKLGAKKVTKKTAKVSKPVAKKATKSVKTTASKVSKATKQVSVVDSLQKIKGVGPKMESMFNSIEIFTYNDLAKYNKKTLTAAIENMYPNARKFDASGMIQNAKRFAKK